jgi:pimeloyl-ACP methyl ester carboxylesterase
MPIRAVFYEDLEKNKEKYDIASRLAGLTTPVLLVQGDHDFNRLKAGFEKMREAAPQQRFVTIEGGTHTFGAVHPFGSTTLQLEQALQVTLEFLSTHFT